MPSPLHQPRQIDRREGDERTTPAYRKGLHTSQIIRDSIRGNPSDFL